DNGVLVAKFTERCADDGATTAEVVFVRPIRLGGSCQLAIYARGNGRPMIAVTVTDPTAAPNSFGGRSAIGCLNIGTEIALTQSPTNNPTLLLRMGEGSVTAAAASPATR